jgi:pimeloyl-ACP methyl ester carboxylesterase
MKGKRLPRTVRWIGRILLIGLSVILGLVVFLLVRESIVRSRYRSEYPPPGQMIGLETHSIHLYCVGAGSPTVIFESDLDQYGVLSWVSVQGKIGRLTRACSYDRAGILWSEPGPRPRDGKMIAAELAAVLDTAGEHGPYVLVAHGFGGAYARIFAGQNPDDVCGMVLLESSHPDMLTRFAELGIDPEIPNRQIRPLILLLSHLGIPGRYKGNPYGLPPEIYDPVQAFLPESSMAWFDEKVEAANTLAQAGQYEYLGDLPLIVVATTTSPSSMDDQGQARQDLWLELQHDLLLLSEKSEIRTYEDGHYPQLQIPDPVVEAVQDVLGRCTQATP